MRLTVKAPVSLRRSRVWSGGSMAMNRPGTCGDGSVGGGHAGGLVRHVEDAEVLAGAEPGVGQELADRVVAGDEPALVTVGEDHGTDRAGLAQPGDLAGRVERARVALHGQAVRDGNRGAVVRHGGNHLAPRLPRACHGPDTAADRTLTWEFVTARRRGGRSSGRGVGSRRAVRPVSASPSRRPSIRHRFIPHTRSGVLCAGRWKGQLPSTISPSRSAGLETVCPPACLTTVSSASLDGPCHCGRAVAGPVRGAPVEDRAWRFAGWSRLLDAARPAAARPVRSAARGSDTSISCADRRYSFAGRPAPGPVRPVRRSWTTSSRPSSASRVEVERGSLARQLHRRGGLVATHGGGLADHVLVQPAPGRLVERCYRGDLRRPGSASASTILKPTSVD